MHNYVYRLHVTYTRCFVVVIKNCDGRCRRQFLERATGLLALPCAARRLFDAAGREHFDLRDLSRDQVVFVSCGEPWADPTVSKAEQQRRHLLANLGDDVAQIQQFIRLRAAASECDSHTSCDSDPIKGRSSPV